MEKNSKECLTKSKLLFNSFDQDAKTKKKLLEYKIEQEIKSQPEELGKELKKGLLKHELTQELYIPKKIPQNKSYNKDLLIDKIKNCDQNISYNRKITKHLAIKNASFSKIYNYIKEVEGKNNRQQKYFDDTERLYLENNYNLKICGIKPGDNIFSYSILMDKTFGNNIKQDAVRLLNEIGKKEIRRENKLLIKFNNEVIEQRLQKKVNNKNKALIKRIIAKNDLGVDDINNIGNRKSIKSLYEKKYLKLNINRNKKYNKGNTLSDIKIKPEDNYLNRKLKENIIKIKNNINNIESEFNNSNDEKSNLIKVIFDKNDDDNIINNHSQNNYRPTNITKDENKDTNIENNKSNKKQKIYYYSSRNFKLRNQLNNSPTKNNNKLPKINNSFEEIKNLNFSSSTTTNCSITEKNKEKMNLNILTPNINKTNKNTNILDLTSTNIGRDINTKHLIYDWKTKYERPKKLINIKKIKRKISNNNILSFLRTLLIGNGDKKLMSRKEFNHYISKFQEKHNDLLQTFRKQKIKNSNLHGFAANFQRVTEGKDFGKLYEKNKYLKKNNYSNLISNFYEFNDESDDMNVKNIDNRISNIYYELADFILNEHQTNIRKKIK